MRKKLKNIMKNFLKYLTLQINMLKLNMKKMLFITFEQIPFLKLIIFLMVQYALEVMDLAGKLQNIQI